MRVGARPTRLAGFSGVVCFVVGLALGLLFAPVTGRELRAKLQRALGRGAGLSDAELAEKVGFELGHAPRTWHLPQPDVAVVEGRVQLRGQVPHDTAREELAGWPPPIPGVGGGRRPARGRRLGLTALIAGSLRPSMFERSPTVSTASSRGFAGEGRLSEADVDEVLREIRLALLEADVNFKVVKGFVGAGPRALRRRGAERRRSTRRSRSSRSSTTS